MTHIIIDMLTENSVSVITKRYAEIEGENFLISTTRKAYSNSTLGRSMVENELSEADAAAIFAKWGDTPTVEDPPEAE